MKHIGLLLIGLVLFYGGVAAQNDKISFNEKEHDFGIIGEKDGKVSFDFILTNNGDEPILINNVTASCGCTTPQWTKEPIEKGKKGTVTVTYNPLGRVSPFNKTITIYTGQNAPLRVLIKGEVVQGEVVKKAPDVKKEYPVAIGDYLMKSKDLNFGQVTVNENKTIRLDVFNNSDKPVSQKALKLPKYMTAIFNPDMIPAKTAGAINVTLNVQGQNIYGNLSGGITLLINGVNQYFSYNATVVDDFSQWSAPKKTNAGKINLNFTEISFGNFTTGNTRTLKISNSGSSVLNVRSIQSSDPSVTVSKSRLSIKPNEIDEIKVNVADKNIQSKFSATLTIISDDPNKPVCEVTILANKS